ncbi:cuticle protein AM/CP1114-like [Oratosquilla oratoria]|uniref:cuticle protein AM/CP1114-like n=1 Tax=Oratosquilla oratoria TaxID=337810 RepID=UPI003F7670A5
MVSTPFFMHDETWCSSINSGYLIKIVTQFSLVLMLMRSRSQCVLVSLFVAAATSVAGAPATGASASETQKASPMLIIKDDRIHPDGAGSHSLNFETENGIVVQSSGSEGALGGAHMQGSFSYPMEDGSLAVVHYVADEKGFQPESSLLPVAPAFPHPIPDFVLEQIERARIEDEAKAKKEALKA